MNYSQFKFSDLRVFFENLIEHTFISIRELHGWPTFSVQEGIFSKNYFITSKKGPNSTRFYLLLSY